MKTNRNQHNVNSTFKTELKKARANGAKLTQEKSATIALATIATLYNDHGTPITITPQQRDVLKAMFYPKVELRISIIKATLSAAACTMDPATEELLNKLLTPAVLEQKLSKVKIEAPVIDWSEMVDEEDVHSEGSQDESPSGDESVSTEEENEPVSPQPAQVETQKLATAK